MHVGEVKEQESELLSRSASCQLAISRSRGRGPAAYMCDGEGGMHSATWTLSRKKERSEVMGWSSSSKRAIRRIALFGSPTRLQLLR